MKWLQHEWMTNTTKMEHNRRTAAMCCRSFNSVEQRYQCVQQDQMDVFVTRSLRSLHLYVFKNKTENLTWKPFFFFFFVTLRIIFLRCQIWFSQPSDIYGHINGLSVSNQQGASGGITQLHQTPAGAFSLLLRGLTLQGGKMTPLIELISSPFIWSSLYR